MEKPNKTPMTCGRCKHFVIQPMGSDLTQHGECHRMPPCCTVVPQPNGQMAQLTAYPQMTIDYPVCACFEDKHIFEVV